MGPEVIIDTIKIKKFFEIKKQVCIFALLKNMVYNTAAPSTSAAPFP